LTPANAEAIDVMVSGITGGTADFVFAPGQFAPGSLFNSRAGSRSRFPAAAVVDSTALGKLYASPVTLTRFEENAGATNTSLVRTELNAVFAASGPPLLSGARPPSPDGSEEEPAAKKRPPEQCPCSEG
jgi:hypothetical protein